ncbi:preprotein translocase [Companilactobacillus ginsenosidimutans]|uniref:Preprotein translocase n=2 Tax=Companilactobacillus ginsenosidimutans TaxID=1007676 RepID=A0A0H4QMR1_9LACO|nr:preprotein translocase [Companilactobacillus ginsenosidimutans]
MLIFIVILFVGMYFISIRPQKKQQQKRQDMLKQMDKGDKVVTLGGIKGTVESIDREAKEVVVDCDGIYLTFDLNFIRSASPADNVKDATNKNAKKVEASDDKADEKPAEEPKEETKAEEKPAEEAKSDDTKSDDAEK